MIRLLFIILLINLCGINSFIPNKIIKQKTCNIGLHCKKNNDIYRRYLIEIKKTKKLLSKINETGSTTLLRFVKDNNKEIIEDIIENKKLKIKKIKIDDNLILNVENCEKIIIKCNNNKLEIEIKEEEDVNIIKNSIKELDIMITLLNVFDILLNMNINK